MPPKNIPIPAANQITNENGVVLGVAPPVLVNGQVAAPIILANIDPATSSYLNLFGDPAVVLTPAILEILCIWLLSQQALQTIRDHVLKVPPQAIEPFLRDKEKWHKYVAVILIEILRFDAAKVRQFFTHILTLTGPEYEVLKAKLERRTTAFTAGNVTTGHVNAWGRRLANFDFSTLRTAATIAAIGAAANVPAPQPLTPAFRSVWALPFMKQNPGAKIDPQNNAVLRFDLHVTNAALYPDASPDYIFEGSTLKELFDFLQHFGVRLFKADAGDSILHLNTELLKSDFLTYAASTIIPRLLGEHRAAYDVRIQNFANESVAIEESRTDIYPADLRARLLAIWFTQELAGKAEAGIRGSASIHSRALCDKALELMHNVTNVFRPTSDNSDNANSNTSFSNAITRSDLLAYTLAYINNAYGSHASGFHVVVDGVFDQIRRSVVECFGLTGAAGERTRQLAQRLEVSVGCHGGVADHLAGFFNFLFVAYEVYYRQHLKESSEMVTDFGRKWGRAAMADEAHFQETFCSEKEPVMKAIFYLILAISLRASELKTPFYKTDSGLKVLEKSLGPSLVSTAVAGSIILQTAHPSAALTSATNKLIQAMTGLTAKATQVAIKQENPLAFISDPAFADFQAEVTGFVCGTYGNLSFSRAGERDRLYQFYQTSFHNGFYAYTGHEAAETNTRPKQQPPQKQQPQKQQQQKQQYEDDSYSDRAFSTSTNNNWNPPNPVRNNSVNTNSTRNTSVATLGSTNSTNSTNSSNSSTRRTRSNDGAGPDKHFGCIHHMFPSNANPDEMRAAMDKVSRHTTDTCNYRHENIVFLWNRQRDGGKFEANLARTNAARQGANPPQAELEYPGLKALVKKVHDNMKAEKANQPPP